MAAGADVTLGDRVVRTGQGLFRPGTSADRLGRRAGKHRRYPQTRPARHRTLRRAGLTPEPSARCYCSVMSGLPTLYGWAGGRPAIARLIDRFYDRVERDELLSPFFPGGVSEQHREHVTTWWSEVFGGPADYTDRLGGYPAMLAHHRNLNITAEQRFRFSSMMSLAADDAKLPADPEFRAALVGYLEWGTRLAMHNSQPGADVAQQAPVPHWGWGVAPPYQP
jgi:hemoglobin